MDSKQVKQQVKKEVNKPMKEEAKKQANVSEIEKWLLESQKHQPKAVEEESKG